MKIIHTADWHLGKNIEGHSRLPEQEQFLQDFVRICEEEKADMVLIAGDVYDHYNPPAAAENLFYNTLKQLSRDGERMIVIISGNHDSPERLTASGPLAMEHGIVMCATPASVVPTGLYGKNEITESGVGYIKGFVHGERFNLLLVPFPSEKRLGEVIVREKDTEILKTQSYEKRMKQLFEELAIQFEEEAIHLVLSHIFMMHSLEEGSERSISLGGSYLLSPSILPNADYIALGHIHKPQQVPGHSNARYSGSPIHYHLKETSFQKEVTALEVEAGKEVKIKHIPLPIYKPIEKWICDSVEDALARCKEKKKENSWVYLEIKTEEYIREKDIKKMKSLKDDILSITPIFPENMTEHIDVALFETLPFETLVKDFYYKRFQTQMSEETLEVLRELMGEEEI